MAIIVKDRSGKVLGSFPDGTPPDTIKARLAAPPAPPAAPARMPGPVIPPSVTMQALAQNPMLKNTFGLSGLAEFIGNNPEQLPVTLATPGSFIPGPLGVGLSAGGAAVGEGGRQMLMGEPLNPGKIGMEGAEHGALAATGAALAKPLQWMGQRTLDVAVGASPAIKMRIANALSRKAGRTVGPVEGSIGKVMAKERIGVTEGDWKRVREEVKTLTEKANKIADKAGEEGFSFKADDFTGPLDAMRKSLKREWDSIPELKQFDAIVRRFKNQMGDRVLTPRQTLTLRRRWDRTAEKIYDKAAKAGGAPVGRQSARMESAAAAASGARNALEGMYPHGRELADVNQRMSELMPVRDAILQALLARTGATPPFMSPVVSSTIMPQALRSRTLLGALGLGMTDPLTLGATRNVPRVASEMLDAPERIQEFFNSGELPDSLKTNGR